MKKLKREDHERARRLRQTDREQGRFGSSKSINGDVEKRAGRLRPASRSDEGRGCCERCPIMFWECCRFCKRRNSSAGNMSPTSDATGMISSQEVGTIHGLAGSANADFTFVIASQGEMADAMGFSVE